MSNSSSRQPVLWEELTWEQITALREDGMTMVILPVGAFAYTVNKESVYGAVGTPSQAELSFGKQILETCIVELSEQLKRALVEGTPLEEMPPNITPNTYHLNRARGIFKRP